MVKVIVLTISSTMAVEAATSLQLEIKFWPEMKTKEKRDNINKSKEKKKSRSKHFKKTSNNTLIKLIRLVEVNKRHNFIRTVASDLLF